MAACRLIGVTPIHRKFEFQRDGAPTIFGAVGEEFGQSILERMSTEELRGERWRGFFHKKLAEKVGRDPVDYHRLLRLEDESSSPQAEPLDQPVRS